MYPAAPQPTQISPPAAALERMEPGTTLLLGVVTLGIYPLVKFWQAINQYRVLAGRATNVGTLFGAYVACTIGGAFLTSVLIGFLLIPAGYVVGWMLLGEVMRLRDEVRQRHGLTATVHEAGQHKGMWIAGQLLSWILIGIVPLLMQTWWFFADHTALATELERKRGTQQTF
jgi:hypothetical protein